MNIITHNKIRENFGWRGYTAQQGSHERQSRKSQVHGYPSGVAMPPATRQKCKHRGFSLVELLVVVSLIILVAGIALPTVFNLFGAGADAQAYNLLAAQLAYARSQAIFLGTYVGVHVQMADRTELEKHCYSAVVQGNPDGGGDIVFSLLDGSKPEKIPGNMAFGKLTSNFFGAGANDDEYQNLDDLDDEDGFTTFTIVFSPDGQVVKYVEDDAVGNIVFANDDLFSASSNTSPTGTELWSLPDAEPGVTAVTIFNYAEMEAISSANKREDYMHNNWGQILALNIYTGRFFHRY